MGTGIICGGEALRLHGKREAKEGSCRLQRSSIIVSYTYECSQLFSVKGIQSAAGVTAYSCNAE